MNQAMEGNAAMNKLTTTLIGAMIGSAIFAIVGVGLAHAETAKRGALIEPTSWAMHVKEIGPAPMIADAARTRPAAGRTRLANICYDCF